MQRLRVVLGISSGRCEAADARRENETKNVIGVVGGGIMGIHLIDIGKFSSKGRQRIVYLVNNTGFNYQRTSIFGRGVLVSRYDGDFETLCVGTLSCMISQAQEDGMDKIHINRLMALKKILRDCKEIYLEN